MKTKVMGMFALLVIALSVAGFVYAHWSDMVTIEGTAEMGSLTFGFGRIVAEWDSEDYLDCPENKCAAEGVCNLSMPETDVHTLKTVYKLLTFNITGGYPQYWAINKFTLNNSGTIPVVINNVTIILPNGFTAVENTTHYPGAMWEVQNSTTGLAVYNIWLYKEPEDYGAGWALDPPWEFPGGFGSVTGVRNLTGNQIDPCNDVLTEICVDIKQEGAEGCHTYTFSIEIEAIQWNKYTP